LANHILAAEGGLDAWGHVSLRHPEHPDRFLLSCSRSPELVTEDDIVEHGLNGEAILPQTRPLYYERFIHGAMYEMYPKVQSVIHSHADEVIPFTITGEPLRAVMASAKPIGATIPVWDIEDRFGDDTDMLVSDVERGREMAKSLDGNAVVLLRGHGFVATGETLLEALLAAIYLPRNAHILMNALRLGQVKPLSANEVRSFKRLATSASGPQRAWEYWSLRLGRPYRPGGFSTSSALAT
jgi:ribulose-5-phosphate 4-epimerase/fuculose-1-phosphate aldolase